jgi:hypothetical protein
MKVRGTWRLFRRVCKREIPLWFLFFFGATVLLGSRPPLCWSLAFSLLGHITVKKTLDEWSAWRRDLYPTTHNTRRRQSSVPPAGFEPSIPASDRPQTHALERAVAGIEGKLSLPDANRTMMSRCPAVSVVTILTELTQLAQQDEEFYNLNTFNVLQY